MDISSGCPPLGLIISGRASHIQKNILVESLAAINAGIISGRLHLRGKSGKSVYLPVFPPSEFHCPLYRPNRIIDGSIRSAAVVSRSAACVPLLQSGRGRINIYADIQPCGGRLPYSGQSVCLPSALPHNGSMRTDNGKIDSTTLDLCPKSTAR